VALEETRNSIVGRISKLEITNEGDFIVFDARAGAVFRFAANGKFLNNIGYRGPGEKEYILPLDVKYDSFNNRVLVWDNGKRSILTYELDGRLLSKIHLPWVIGTFGIIDAEHIICYMNNNLYVTGDDTETNYKILKRDGTIEKEFGTFGAEKSDFNPTAEYTFCFQQGRTLCFPPFSPTLFSVEGDSLNAIATFELFENAIPQKWLSGSHILARREIKKHPEMVEIKSVFETDMFYMMNLERDEKIMLCQVKKDSKEVKSISLNLINDIYGMVSNTKIKYSSRNKLYFSIDPMEFEGMNSFLRTVPENGDVKTAIMNQKEYISAATSKIFGQEAALIQLDSLKSASFELVPGERALIEKMSQKSNPIIQICTLK
jgi:hypothetical protein